MYDGGQGWHKDTEWKGADLEWDSGVGEGDSWAIVGECMLWGDRGGRMGKWERGKKVIDGLKKAEIGLNCKISH